MCVLCFFCMPYFRLLRRDVVLAATAYSGLNICGTGIFTAAAGFQNPNADSPSSPQNVYLVTIGTVAGHACCTALAVIGGRYVSTKISVKHVTAGGAILFLLFGIVYLYEAFNGDVGVPIPVSPETPVP